MFAFVKTLNNSWINSRSKALWWYYTGRFHLRSSTQSVVVSLKPPGNSREYFLDWQTPEDARIALNFFSNDNSWLKYPLPSEAKTIVDLGANIGMSSLFWSMQYPDARIEAVEMVAANAERCRKLFEKNQINANVTQAAVAASDGVMQYQANDSHTCNHLQVFDDIPAVASRLVSVQTYSLASLLEKLSLQQVDILKVDIEGAESFLLQTVESWAPAVRWMLMELHHNIKYEEAVATLKKAGFTIVSEDRHIRTELFCKGPGCKSMLQKEKC